MAVASDRTPSYLSSRSADVILSDVRPTKLKGEALRSINVFLDELLWLILSTSRSFSTERLKGGLLKILPTPLGKDALLEAEIELRAYWERTNPTNPTAPHPSTDENIQDFPLQPAFELLRLKCEAYSTLNDADEDTDAEARWQAKMAQTSGFTASKAAFVPPAALYLTAILESICEHVISNTGRVTARDSSRTAATLQDFYIALCEDDTIYALFKTMKVHDQIELQTKASRPRRSKSLSRNERAASPSQATPTDPFNNENLVAARSKSRLSSDSVVSNPNSGVPLSSSRTSLDKSKAKRLFRRTSGEKDGPLNGHGQGDVYGNHKRSGSSLSENTKRAWSNFDENAKTESLDMDDESTQEFDDLMRSGSTMKVSLTPDRLKTFEVFNKEKNKRVNKPPPSSATSAIRSASVVRGVYDSSTDTSASEDATIDTQKNDHNPPALQLRRVDSIVETEEDDAATPIISQDRPRHSSTSKVSPPASIQQIQQLSNPKTRSRSVSASQPSTQSYQAIGRKQSLSAVSNGSHQTTRLEKGSRVPAKQFGGDSGIPKNKRTTARNRESMDLDDIMNGDSDEDTPKKPQIMLKPATLVEANSQELLSFLKEGPRQPDRSAPSGAQDLISFLNEGPPDTISSATSANVSPVDQKAKTGRFRNMVSRLTRGASTEKLSAQAGNEEYNSALRRSNTGYIPPPSTMPPPLSAKKSLRNISAAASQALPPRPPLSPPQSPSQGSAESGGTPLSRSRNPSTTTRKAVPIWGETVAPHDGDTTQVPIASRRPDLPPSSTHVASSQNEMKGKSESTRGSDRYPSTKPIVTSSLLPSVNSSSSVKQRAQASGVIHTNGLPLPASTPSHPFSSHITDFRRLMSKATTADECRLLLDMFLAQSGVPVDTNGTTTPETPTPDGSSENHQVSLVEVLLSNGDASRERADNGSYQTDLPTPPSTSFSSMT